MAQDQKQDAIIEAAIKRFAHFGVAKTTMNEIAADLALSKASLYYYFPDKLSLYAAVFTKITQAEEAADNKILSEEPDPFKAIMYFLQKRTEFIIRYHNVLEYLTSFGPAKIPAVLKPVFEQLRTRELQRLTSIIEKGVRSGSFKIKEVKKVATLFYEFLDGFRYSFLTNSPNLFPDKKEFQALLKKETEFATIFFNGLTIGTL